MSVLIVIQTVHDRCVSCVRNRRWEAEDHAKKLVEYMSIERFRAADGTASLDGR